jgi:hypothetical protein
MISRDQSEGDQNGFRWEQEQERPLRHYPAHPSAERFEAANRFLLSHS